MSTALQEQSHSIIALDRFIQATRDSGYKGTASAISELVDNSLQAGARQIRIQIVNGEKESRFPIEVIVEDDGVGMDPFTLRQALRFGGSTRFNDRFGLGRYGMGLPNSSLSQAQRVDVYTWKSPDKIFNSYLDVEEISSGIKTEVPPPTQSCPPTQRDISPSGTIIVWSRCDRLENSRISTIVRKLGRELGRRFRYFLWRGVDISINGEVVEPIDPLFLNSDAMYSGALMYGNPMEYEISADPNSADSDVGIVRVIFSELPVADWQGLGNDEKRKLGISKGAGVSIVRADREVDYGWFFLSEKRRENYDDWWRCEIQFDPTLDEAFGITHTKQQIRPKAHLIEALSQDMSATARSLNARARKAHEAAKTATRILPSEEVASAQESLLEPLPVSQPGQDQALLDKLRDRHLIEPNFGADGAGRPNLQYKVVECAGEDTAFYTYTVEKGGLILALNPNHPFYKTIYRPLAQSDTPRDTELRAQLELLLFAAARGEATARDSDIALHLQRQRCLWSDILATFLTR